NAARGEEAETAVERLPDDAALLEHIRERPVRHVLYQAVTLSDRLREPRAHVGRIGYPRVVRIARVEFAPDERQLWHRRGADLLVHLLYRPAHHVLARDLLGRSEDVFRSVVPIDMGGSEVDRDVLLLAMLDERLDPRRLCRRRPADPNARVDALQ